MRTTAAGLALAFGPAILWPSASAAQLIDAGQQAMIQHQGDLLEQQTAPNNRQGRRSPPKRVSGAVRTAQTGCSIAADRERLRGEHQRRVRLEGRAAADAWLRQAASDLGRRTGERAKSGLAQC